MVSAMESPPRLTFPRHLRVVKRGDFQRAYKQGARARGSCLIVVAVANQLPHPRLGLSVGRVIWKSAVRRNRVRRIFREAFRLQRSHLPEGFDFVLIPAVAKLEPDLARVSAELVELARKAATKWAARRASEAPSSP